MVAGMSMLFLVIWVVNLAAVGAVLALLGRRLPGRVVAAVVGVMVVAAVLTSLASHELGSLEFQSDQQNAGSD